MILKLKRSLVLSSMVVGVLVGAAGSWWYNRPAPPWLEIKPARASYERGSRVVRFFGEYTARKTCSRKEQKTPPEAPDPLVWRQEVQGTGPEVAVLSPRPPPPNLEIGTHDFVIQIPLEEGIEPDGWEVAALVSCYPEPYAIRSKFVKVEYLPAE